MTRTSRKAAGHSIAQGTNMNLHRARKTRNDEFYTKEKDIIAELNHYASKFAGKSVLCNCDAPFSAFRRYFTENFKSLGLARLVCTHIAMDGLPATATIITSDAEETVLLEGNGDFRSPECVRYLKEADVIVTNPPFSLWRDFIELLDAYKKDFLIIGSKTAAGSASTMRMILEGKMWLGHNAARGNMSYNKPDGTVREVPSYWYTNMKMDKPRRPLVLFASYDKNPEMYPRFDNYDAINIPRVNLIPADYKGIMGVPVTFLAVHDPSQFQLVGGSQRYDNSGLRTKKYTAKDQKDFNNLNSTAVLKEKDGHLKGTFLRVFIQRKDAA